jgi:hypothetical protein
MYKYNIKIHLIIHRYVTYPIDKIVTKETMTQCTNYYDIQLRNYSKFQLFLYSDLLKE